MTDKLKNTLFLFKISILLLLFFLASCANTSDSDDKNVLKNQNPEERKAEEEEMKKKIEEINDQREKLKEKLKREEIAREEILRDQTLKREEALKETRKIKPQKERPPVKYYAPKKTESAFPKTSSEKPSYAASDATSAKSSSSVAKYKSRNFKGKRKKKKNIKKAPYIDPANIKIPQFPWPPPDYSSHFKIDKKYFPKNRCKVLNNVEEILNRALKKNKYEKSFYAIVDNDQFHGFAVATRLEKFNKEDGTSKNGPDRWSLKDANMSLKKFFKTLFFGAPSGYFRIIVFVVADIPIKRSEENLSIKEVEKIFRGGSTNLSKNIRDMPFTKDYNVTALIYEYEYDRENKSGNLIEVGLTGEKHIKNSKILDSLVVNRQ